MSYAIVGILVVAFIAFVILSAKAWHWSNIVFLVLNFLAALGVVIAMSQVLDQRRQAMQEAERYQQDVARVESEIEAVLYGAGLASEYAPESLRGLSEALNLETAGRGRVWRHGLVEAKDGNRVFKFSGDRIQNPDEQDKAKMDDMQLFVYADREYDGQLYPVRFVGTMRVVQETANSVELEPEFIADNQEYENPSQTWTLFEKSPADQRDAFIRDSGITLDIDAADFNQKLSDYRRLLVENYMPPQLFDLDLSSVEQAQQYEYLVDRVLFDGLPLARIESWIEAQEDRIARRFDPANEEIFVIFQFNDKSNRPYQVDASGNVETDGQFTRSGQAVDPALKAGGEIEFQKGDKIIVDQLTADGYQRGDEVVSPLSSKEPVTEISRIFRRQLRDFPYLLRSLQRQVADYETETARVMENNSKTQNALADAGLQASERDAQIQKLQQDQNDLQADADTVKQFAETTSLQKNDLERTTNQLEMEIREQHRRIQAMARALEAQAQNNVSQPARDE